MADADEAKRTWSAWIGRWMKTRGMTQTMLVAASDGDLNLKTVSKWVRGAAAASPELAVITARIFDVSVAEAMEAAGYPLTAEELAKNAPQAPIDPGIREILAADLLTDEEKAQYIQMYQADLAQAAARAREMVRIAEEARRKSAS